MSLGVWAAYGILVIRGPSNDVGSNSGFYTKPKASDPKPL